MMAFVQTATAIKHIKMYQTSSFEGHALGIIPFPEIHVSSPVLVSQREHETGPFLDSGTSPISPETSVGLTEVNHITGKGEVVMVRVRIPEKVYFIETLLIKVKCHLFRQF